MSGVPESGPLWAAEGRFCMQFRVAGGGERVKFRTAVSCGRAVVQQMAIITPELIRGPLVLFDDFRNELRTTDFLDRNIVDTPGWTVAAFIFLTRPLTFINQL